MEHRVAEPPVEVLATAVARGHRRLSLALRTVGRALDANVEVIVVLPIWPYLAQPRAVVAGLAAQRLLDGGIHEDTVDLGLFRRRLDQRRVRRRPDVGIDVLAVGRD